MSYFCLTVASVATPALADSTSGLAGIDKAQEHANENVICHLNTVEARLTGGIVVCPLG
jgi:hypothetical protein